MIHMSNLKQWLETNLPLEPRRKGERLAEFQDRELAWKRMIHAKYLELYPKEPERKPGMPRNLGWVWISETDLRPS